VITITILTDQKNYDFYERILASYNLADIKTGRFVNYEIRTFRLSKYTREPFEAERGIGEIILVERSATSESSDFGVTCTCTRLIKTTDDQLHPKKVPGHDLVATTNTCHVLDGIN